MEPSREDVETLLLHYKMIRGDVNLLMQFCAERQIRLVDGFRDVINEIAALEGQLEGMKE